MLDVLMLTLYWTNPLGGPRILQADRQTDMQIERQTIEYLKYSLERPRKKGGMIRKFWREIKDGRKNSWVETERRLRKKGVV